VGGVFLHQDYPSPMVQFTRMHNLGTQNSKYTNYATPEYLFYIVEKYT